MVQNLKFAYALIIVLSLFLVEFDWTYTHVQCRKNADCPKYLCMLPLKPKCKETFWCTCIEKERL
ncbi:putative Late nodulin [Medicago truncatula]|uniref:Putative Late nodulin n=1 Tax=Medicago truncatula TaxID=3880 RepID=A0A396GHY2_MEDTR|nr:putative Late nodulin [Medicago truncatula]